MEALFLRVGWISLTCSAVLIPLLVGKGWLRQHVRARALYVVWLILALRLVIPVDLSLPEPAVTVEAPSYQVSLPARAPSANLPTALPTEESAAEAGQTAPAAASAVRTIPVTALLSALWLFGALAAALVQGGGYLLARRRLLRDARPDLEAEEQAGQTAAGLGLKRAVPVRRSGQVRTPMVLGLIRPVLLLPEGQAVDEVVLCHELTHLKRLDLAYKALLVAACWLHWFNPLVWWMSRAASENLELCCDDDVAAGRDAAFRRKYGELLLSTAEEKPGPTLSSRFGGSKQAMRDRLANLFVKKKRGRLLACAALAVLALVGGLAACEGRPAMTDQEAVEALNESVDFSLNAEGINLSFTLPEGERDWDIRLSQNVSSEDPDVIQSFNETQWTPGESYSFFLPRDILLEYPLSLDVSLNEGAEGFSMGLSFGTVTLIDPQTALEQLRSSIIYDGERVSFTIPEGDREWNIHIAGRAEVEWLGGMSLHFLDGTDWTPGETYSFELSSLAAQDVTELTMHIFQGTQEWEIDLLPYLPYVNSEYGFTLTLPQSWRGQVDIVDTREDETDRTVVEFYMRNAFSGRVEGSGWLVGIYRCSFETWQGITMAEYPHNEQRIATIGEYVFYASGPTDVQYDENNPAEVERYRSLEAEIPELLDSFALLDGGAYAAAQTWLEEQVAAGPPEYTQGYDYVDGRIESLEYVTSFEGYDVYRLDYRFLVDHPENVVLAGGMSLNEEGWLRDYPMVAYLILHNGTFASVSYTELGPQDARFWYERGGLPEDVRWEAAAWTAYLQAYDVERLYWGRPRWNEERSISQAELETVGYQVQGNPPDTWRKVDWTEDRAASYNMIWSVFSSYFSDDLTQRRVDGMLTGPNAPYLCYDGALYFRNDVPCGPGVREVYMDWDSYAVTRVMDQPDFEGIEFTLSGSRDEDGAWEDGTWSFRFGRDDPGGLLRFYTWFDET